MTQDAGYPTAECIFCDIAAGRGEASIVFADETVVAFLALFSVTPGHLLVVPRAHAVGLEDLDRATGAHAWSVAHDMARALRRSELRCEGINVWVCDGEVAFQTVPHFHLHVIPRFEGDGWTAVPEEVENERSVLDLHAQQLRAALALSD